MAAARSTAPRPGTAHEVMAEPADDAGNDGPLAPGDSVAAAAEDCGGEGEGGADVPPLGDGWVEVGPWVVVNLTVPETGWPSALTTRNVATCRPATRPETNVCLTSRPSTAGPPSVSSPSGPSTVSVTNDGFTSSEKLSTISGTVRAVLPSAGLDAVRRAWSGRAPGAVTDRVPTSTDTPTADAGAASASAEAPPTTMTPTAKAAPARQIDATWRGLRWYGGGIPLILANGGDATSGDCREVLPGRDVLVEGCLRQ
jgi:hypothetical protein